MDDRDARAREHLANERTFLAWIRTSLAFMGLGFVVARFGLYLRQLAFESGTRLVPTQPQWSAGIGILFVAVGLVAAAASTVRFMRVRSQIERGSFEPEAVTELTVVLATITGGCALALYLASSG